MHSAVVGIIDNKYIPWMNVTFKLSQHSLQCGRNGTQVQWNGQALRHQPAVGVGERRRKIHVISKDTGICGSTNGHGHLIRNGKQRVLKQLQGNWISLHQCKVKAVRDTNDLGCRTIVT